jgi:hypothetical protein
MVAVAVVCLVTTGVRLRIQREQRGLLAASSVLDDRLAQLQLARHHRDQSAKYRLRARLHREKESSYRHAIASFNIIINKTRRVDNVIKFSKMKEDALRKVSYHAALRKKYEWAARYPWLPVEPDPPEPE